MYQFSRALYRELAPLVQEDRYGCLSENRQSFLTVCEGSFRRLATDRHYFARPARTLFNDIRFYFPMSRQERVYRIVRHYVNAADEWIAQMPRQGYDANGNPLQCRATTRKGTPCQRMPLPHNGYCPSHQHLAETEETEVQKIAA